MKMLNPKTAGRVKKKRPPGALRVNYTINCGACDLTMNHMPDPEIKSWEDLIGSLAKGLWKWKLTQEFGWVCGCQEFNKQIEERIQANAQTQS